MFKKIVIGLFAIVVVAAVVVALQPSQFGVERTAAISAPAEAVFAQVNDFHKWEAWSPWEKIDPAMRRTFEGAPAGTGAIYAWAGNAEVGEGRMTMAESRPNNLIRIDLQFLEPFASTATAEFTFKPEGGQTVVTWSMTGENDFLAKAIHLFVNLDRMVGGQFEKGLANLASVSEAAARN